MEYRTLGRTGLRVSVLGFGCGAYRLGGAPESHEEGIALVVHLVAFPMGKGFPQEAPVVI